MDFSSAFWSITFIELAFVGLAFVGFAAFLAEPDGLFAPPWLFDLYDLCEWVDCVSAAATARMLDLCEWIEFCSLGLARGGPPLSKSRLSVFTSSGIGEAIPLLYMVLL
jgi:hypothetical protein